VKQTPDIDTLFTTAAERYIGADPKMNLCVHVRLGDRGNLWEIHCAGTRAYIRKGGSRRKPQSIIDTDSKTWLSISKGKQIIIDAFLAGDLKITGDLDTALQVSTLFLTVTGQQPPLTMKDIELSDERVTSISTGSGEDVLLIHGLGATKSSFLPTAAALRHKYRVHVIDLPGFGTSSKSSNAPYNAPYFARVVRELLDKLKIQQAHLVGNSMGGRIAIEVGLQQPERVKSLSLLCPAVAFIKRTFHPIVRLIRPEIGFVPHRFTNRMVEQQIQAMFSNPDRIDPTIAEAVVREFQQIYRQSTARYAFLAAARNIYLDPPFGQNGFYPRLAKLQPPAMFVWGSHDILIPPGFRSHVERWLPSAEQHLFEDCGHAPQIEHPEKTAKLLTSFIGKHCDKQPAKTRKSAKRAA